jgi:DNA-binding transcriptional MocR family regulator
VGIAPGTAFFAQPPSRAYMRLSFGAHAAPDIERGVSILGNILRVQLQQMRRLASRTDITTSLL